MEDETEWEMSKLPELEESQTVMGGCNRVGQPLANIKLSHGQQLVALASASSVYLINERLEGAPLHTLQPFEGFPTIADKMPKVQAVAACSASQRVVAVAGTHVVVWTPKNKKTWMVHSAFRLSSQDTLALDISKGIMIFGGNSLSFWKLDDKSTALPVWRKVSDQVDAYPISVVSISPCRAFVATTCEEARHIVRIWNIHTDPQDQLKASLSLASELWHPEPVSRFTWKNSSTAQRAAIFTESKSGIMRIFTPQIDDELFFSLAATVNHPYSASRPVCSLYLDASHVTDTFVRSSPGTPSSSLSSDWDSVVTLFRDGSVGVVENVSESPVRCIQQRPMHFHPGLSVTASDARRLSMITSSLRYLLVSKNPSLATEDDEKPASLTLIGSNPRTASTMIIELPLNLLRRPAPKGGRVRLWRYRPTIDIGQIVRSTDARSFLSISKLSPHYSEQELIFWQARQQQSEVLRVTPTTSICLNAPSNFARDAAAWSDGFALVSQKGKVGIWQLRRGKKSRLEHSQELHLDSSRAKQIACLSQLEENTLFALTEEHEIAVWRSSIEGKFSTRPVRSVSIAPHSNLSSTLQLSTSVLNHSCGELLISSLAPDGITTPRKLIHKRQDVLTTAVFGDYIALATRGDRCVEVSIWDAAESEFKSGLEWKRSFSTDKFRVQLDWCRSPIRQPLLAITFPNHTILLSHQRRDYFHSKPLWLPLAHASPSTNVSTALWLNHHCLLKACGPQISFASPRMSHRKKSTSISEAILEHNGPLPLYHPQFLAQCLSIGKIDFVEQVLRTVNLHIGPVTTGTELSQALAHLVEGGSFSSDSWSSSHAGPAGAGLFTGDILVDDKAVFAQTQADNLLSEAARHGLPDLNQDEVAHFQIIVNTIIEIQEHRRAIDTNGLRYLLAMRSFFLSQSHQQAIACEGIKRQHGHRLRYREIVWAFHSTSQEILLQDSVAACSSKITWLTARALGIFLWLKSREALSNHMEALGRNMFTAGEDRDPIACSLFFIALGKKRLMHGLWKQSYGHSDRASMIRFLDNDFEQPRWQTAALKNAYALLGKQRYEFAAAFFLLGGSLRDAVNVCLRQLDDFQLAIAITRVYEGDSGPILRFILEDYSVPYAVRHGYRWLASWSFWMLGRRDLSIRVIVTPFTTLANSLPKPVTDIGDPKSDDPSLAILFHQLRKWSLQTVSGASRIGLSTEFNFILYMAEILRELGCHWIALELVSTWEFADPDVTRAAKGHVSEHQRKPSLLLGRHQSIKLDVEDIPSTMPSRTSSPASQQNTQGNTNTAQVKELFKKAKQVTQVPDFDASAFGF